MNQFEKHDIFNKRCGEVLRISINVESNIEMFISNYFFKIQDYKTRLFEDLILYKMNFDRKINLFKDICKHEKIYNDNTKNVIKDCHYVRDIRNKVAHFGATYLHLSDNYEKDKIILEDRKSHRVKRKDTLEVTGELVNKINKRLFSVQKGVSNAHNLLIEIQKKNQNQGLNRK